MPTPIYRIADWDDRHSVSQAAKVKSWHWCPFPMDDDERLRRAKLFQRQAGEPDDAGFARLGVWHILVEAAARMPARGLLVNSQGPLTMDHVAVLMNCHAHVLDRHLPALVAAGYVEKLMRDAHGQLVPYDPTAHAGLFAQEPPETHGRPPVDRQSTDSRLPVDPTKPKTETEQNRPERIETEQNAHPLRLRLTGTDAPDPPVHRPRSAPPPDPSAQPDSVSSDDAPGPSDSDFERRRAWLRFQARLSQHWAPGGPQRAADETCTADLFDQLWPDDAPVHIGKERINRALPHLRTMPHKTNPMAWITQVLTNPRHPP